MGEEGQFWILEVGTAIFFLSNPIVLNSISLVSNMWFGEQERARATAIAGLMAPVGSLMGLSLSGALTAGVDLSS